MTGTDVLSRRRALLGGGACALGLGLPAQARLQAPARPWVVFLNPGGMSEPSGVPLWRMSTQYMQRMAEALHVRLDVQFANRDHLAMLKQAEVLARLAQAPDYVILVNEKALAPRMLRMFLGGRTQVICMHNRVTAEQRSQIGNERAQLPHWLGSVVADNMAGSYRLMSALYRQCPSEHPQVLGITGDPRTPVSQERALGVQHFMDEAGRGKYLQTVNADWSYADAEQKTRLLLNRYRKADILWTANDSMALGALHACEAMKLSPLVGGMGGWPEALERIRAGRLTATVAGHFLLGAWTLALIHDHFHGLDFSQAGSAEMVLDYLTVLDRPRLARAGPGSQDRLDRLDLASVSRVANHSNASTLQRIHRLLGQVWGEG